MRYLRLYGYFMRFSFSRAMEFRLDFYFRIVMDVVFYIVQLAFFAIIYKHTSLLGGWTLDQVYVFAAALFMIDALHMTIFSNNLWWFPVFVNKGDLDYYLVRPVSTLFFVSLRDFAANSFLNIAISSGILAWALLRYPGGLAPEKILLFLALLVAGSFIYYCLHMSFLIPVFWLHSNNGLREVYYQLQKYSEKPDGIYSGWLWRSLTTVLPFALIVSFPTRVLFEEASAATILHILAAAVGSFLFMRWLWGHGLRGYSSASS